jgi:hypothetical protein
MLSKHVIAGFLKKTDTAALLLKDYAPTSHLYFLEARYALYELKLILTSDPEDRVEESLLAFLSGRWEKVLKNTDAQYLHDFTSPANQACIEIARELGRIRNVPFLLLLMPTLQAVEATNYLTSSYTDDDLSLQDLLLSDENDHLMHIPDILDGAQEDGILKHNSLFLTLEGRHEVKVLSLPETNRLLSRSKEVKDAYEALQVLVKYTPRE